MEEAKITKIEKLEDLNDKEIRVTVIMDKQAMADKFIPYYTISDELKKALVPILVQEVLKNKEEILHQVLVNVDWPEIVRSEVAQKVIQEIAQKSRY